MLKNQDTVRLQRGHTTASAEDGASGDGSHRDVIAPKRQLQLCGEVNRGAPSAPWIKRSQFCRKVCDDELAGGRVKPPDPPRPALGVRKGELPPPQDLALSLITARELTAPQTHHVD